MSRNLRYDGLRAVFWVVLTAVNGGLLGWDLADGSKHAWFSGTLAVLCLLFSTFTVRDFWIDWQDERYERAYLASLEDFPAPGEDQIVIVTPHSTEVVDVEARTIDVFKKTEE